MARIGEISLRNHNLCFLKRNRYRCTASNKATNKTKQSNSADVTVIPNNNTQKPPEILNIMSNTSITALVGEDVLLHCIADGWPLPTVQWLNSECCVLLVSIIKRC